jgi:hypothetical protein
MALHWIAIPLRFIATSELGRYAQGKEPASMENEN